MAKKVDKIYYVDNKKLYGEMVKYVEAYKKAKSEGTQLPRISEYIGECVLKIATKLSYMYRFIKYSYREDMIGDGYENCVAYMHNFNPQKSKNPFAYFTMIIYNAFLHRIGTEHKETYVKYKIIENSDLMGELMDYMSSDTDRSDTANKSKARDTEHMDSFVRNYEEKLEKKRQKAAEKKRGIEVFIEEKSDEQEEIREHSAVVA